MARSGKVVTKPARGTRDFLPADLYRRQHVIGVIRDVYRAHGFEPLETPTYERLDTLTGKYGDEGDQLMFKILHRGQTLVDGIREAQDFLQAPGNIVVGRSGETAPGAERLLSDLGLRYDLTVPLARVVAEYSGKVPPIFKRFQIQPVWRADNPGKARYREFVQCDLDVVGSPSLLAETEVTGAVALCFDRLGFEDHEIRINHRALLRALIDKAGISVDLETVAIVAIDKLDKMDHDAVKAEMVTKGVPAASAATLLDLVTSASSLDALAETMADHEQGAAAVRDIQTVLKLAENTPARGRLVFDPTLARGLGYYTGCIFEMRVSDLGSSLGGGGRYDGLIGMFCGRQIPACGFSIGLDRVIYVMEQRGLFPKGLGAPEVLVATTEKGKEVELTQIAYRLRQEGLRVQLHPKPDKAGKMRKMTDERGIGSLVLLRHQADQVNVWRRESPDVTDRMIEISELPSALR
ncbi:MAG: histidine--tRNA ligase [Myxococcota bacterium]